MHDGLLVKLGGVVDVVLTIVVVVVEGGFGVVVVVETVLVVVVVVETLFEGAGVVVDTMLQGNSEISSFGLHDFPSSYVPSGQTHPSTMGPLQHLSLGSQFLPSSSSAPLPLPFPFPGTHFFGTCISGE